MNVQSVLNKCDQLELFLSDNEIDVLCLTEHWLKEDTVSIFGIEGYSVCGCYCRTNQRGGGTLILVKNNYSAKIMSDVEELSQEGHIELAAAEILNMDAIVISVYRAPSGDINIFLEIMHSVLSMVSQQILYKALYLVGDFNIDMQRQTKNRTILLELCYSFDLDFVMNGISRINKNGATCIDNIFTKAECKINTQTIDGHISDHMTQLIKIEMENKFPKMEKRKTIITRNINEKNARIFKQCLSGYASCTYKICGDAAQASYSDFHGGFFDIFNNCFPKIKKQIKINQYVGISWKTKEIQEAKNKLDALNTIYRVTKNSNIEQLYREYKSVYLNLITNTRRAKNEEYLSKAQNKQKATWDIIRKETGKNGSKAYTGTNEVNLTANQLNTYFTTIGRNITQNITNSNQEDCITMLNKMEPGCLGSCYLYDVIPDEVMEAVKSLKKKVTKDIYGMSTILLAEVIPEIIVPLTDIINMCFREGVFPNELKIAKVVPIYKKGERTVCSNYRPISVLPAISKVFESLIKKRIVSFLERNQLLVGAQHGYRTGKSTVTAIVNMIEDILEARDNQEATEILLCDLSKAFDCVSHDILLQKLHYYGIRGNANTLIKSYLENRKQTVWWQDNLSDVEAVTIGVPQGSILGPLLFIIYINDMPNNILCRKTIVYADDTSLMTRGPLQDLAEMSKVALTSAERWFAANNLKLNTEKTQSLVIATKSEQRGAVADFLGVTVDEGLTWCNHVQILCKKLSTAIYALRAVRKVSTFQAAKQVYYANFHSLAAYGIMIWGMATDSDRVQKLQKRAIRTLCGLQYRDSCRDVFKREKILTITGLYILSCVNFVHANQSRFRRNEHCHEYNTRNREALTIPHHRLKITQQGVDYWGPKLYNHLPVDVKTLGPKTFHRAIKNSLIGGAFYSVEEFLSA